MALDETTMKKTSIIPKSYTTEIDGDSENRLCRYIHRYCFQERIQGYDFCIRHILEDKSAPFKQCTYVQQPQRKRCTNAAPKTDKNERREALCPFHVKQSYMKIKATAVRKKAQEKGPKALLESLEHYCRNPQHDPHYSKETNIAEKCETVDIDDHYPAILKHPSEFLTKSDNETFEFVSDHLDSLGGYEDWEFADEEYLRHAGVLTSKEVIRIARDKAIHLKSLYCDELKRTYYKLKELRREYLREKNSDKAKNEKLSAEKCKKLSYLQAYHSQLGVHKVMSRKSELKRIGYTAEPSKCIFVEGGRKCNQVAVVCTCYCLNHLALDPNQCLFTTCSFGSKEKCSRPVLPIGDFNVCTYHEHATLLSESNENEQAFSATEAVQEQEHFQSIDDIASLGLDGITPGSLFGLDQAPDEECPGAFESWLSMFGEPGESTDTVLSEEQVDLMQIQPITLNPPADLLSDSRKTDSEEEN